jgi:predicted amino acid racemase
MFLESLLQKNRAFVEAAIELHQQGKIPANSCVLDLDMLRRNSAIFAAEAKRLGLKTFAMTKQFGRTPPALQAIVDGGIEAFVAVDLDCARPIHQAGHHLGNIGHLVQIPRYQAKEAAAMKADYWTVFSAEKSAEAASAATNLGRIQPLLARIQAPGDIFYMGHEGGFAAANVSAVAAQIDALTGAEFAGITTFPALLYDAETRSAQPTPNLKTLEQAASQLTQDGVTNIEINAPGTTSTAVLSMLADAGATQVEPGNGLHGTSPLHAVRDLSEQPAILYLSEISHHYAGKAYCFGGGLYIDPVFAQYPVQALVGRTLAAATDNRLTATFPPDNAIAYYALLDCEPTKTSQPGETVIFGFRQQVFVTRTLVAPVSGIATGMPVVEGIWTPWGTPWSGSVDNQ